MDGLKQALAWFPGFCGETENDEPTAAKESDTCRKEVLYLLLTALMAPE